MEKMQEMLSEELIEKLEGAQSVEEVVSALRSENIDVSAADVEQLMHDDQSELSEETLEQVAGGIANPLITAPLAKFLILWWLKKKTNSGNFGGGGGHRF